jgi:pSer/pThr/pTyr-binding forkhead associated (FHA) protein
MADPRLNSLHLEPARRQEYRRAREVLLRARGSQTLCTSQDNNSQIFDQTIIRKDGGRSETELVHWLADGEFIYPLQVGVNTIGRSSDNDVVLEDVYASRRHCAILVHSTKKCELYDTASKNGTRVNGRHVAGPTLLKSGDEIHISNRQFIFRTRGESPKDYSSDTLGV